jgi:dCTP deaminase
LHDHAQGVVLLAHARSRRAVRRLPDRPDADLVLAAGVLPMMLADREILHAAREYAMIDGFREDHVNPASYDLTLAPNLRVAEPSSAWLDVAEVKPGYTAPVDMLETYVLEPEQFILAATNETLRLPHHLAARVEGKSSLGRIGLAVHITAGFIDPGFNGSITLEIANLLGRPIVLRPNMRIAQLAFTKMSSIPLHPYGARGHYQDQPAGEPVESRFRMPA